MIHLSFTIDLTFPALCRPMLDVLSFCHIQHRLSNIIGSTCNNTILCDTRGSVWRSHSYHGNRKTVGGNVGNTSRRTLLYRQEKAIQGKEHYARGHLTLRREEECNRNLAPLLYFRSYNLSSKIDVSYSYLSNKSVING